MYFRIKQRVKSSAFLLASPYLYTIHIFFQQVHCKCWKARKCRYVVTEKMKPVKVSDGQDKMCLDSLALEATL